MKVAMQQINPTIGDLSGNLLIIKGAITEALSAQADVVVFPELATVGYPPRDLLYNQALWDNHEKVIQELQKFVKAIKTKFTVIVGGLHQVQLTYGRYAKYNAAFVIDNYSKNIRIVHKSLLPVYQIFSEARYFTPNSDLPIPIVIQTETETHECDVLICEDIWNYKFSCDTPWLPGSYKRDPVSELRGTGPLFVINASPYWKGKVRNCINLVKSIAKGIQRPVFYVNQVGSHDDVTFHGGSIFSIPVVHEGVDNSTRIGKLFATDLLICNDIKSYYDLNHIIPTIDEQLQSNKWNGQKVELEDFEVWCDYHAMKLHLVDYCRRTGFKEVVLGLSGGIDSALVAAIAADALGGENVHGVTMPSKFSSEGSWKDAEQLANNLHLGSFQNIPIGDIHQAFRNSLLSGGKQEFDRGTTDENTQPRARAIILMANSNDHNWLLLTTGNRSELSVAYMTLYGDMCGGLAIINDLWKTEVYQMCSIINKYNGELIPVATIEKPPSAELKADQKDSDSLPDYATLDVILEDLIDHEMSDEELMLKHKDVSLVRKIIKMYRTSEFKRKQLPIGTHLRARSFSSGRQIPVACKLTML